MTLTPGTAAVGSPRGAASSSPAQLQVTFTPPGMPTTAIPGQPAFGQFLVTNPGRSAVPVTIRPATAIPGNNGRLEFVDAPDPRFDRDIEVSPSRFMADPGSTTTVNARIDVPRALEPGGYLLGFIARPLLGGPGVAVLNQIGALITLRVPGRTHEHLTARFRDLGRRLPILGHAQLAGHGSVTLRVLDDGPSSLFSFHEVTADLRPIGVGHAVLDGHTPRLTNNLRQLPQLFMPGRWTDHQIAWRASPLGFGQTRLTAVVSYHADASTTRAVSTTATVWIVSPWCLLTIVGWMTLLLLASSRRARSLVRGSRRRRGPDPVQRAVRTTGTVIVALFATTLLVAASTDPGDWLVYAATAGAGTLGMAAAVVRPPRSRIAPAVLARRIRIGALVHAAVGMLAGTAAVVAVAGGRPPGLAWAVFAAVATWVLLLRGLLHRCERPQSAVAQGPAGDGPLAPANPA